MLKIIEGQPVSGFVDHDYDKIKTFSLKGKIEWFEYRFNKILLNPIEAMDKIANKDRGRGCPLENDDASIYTIIILSMCVGIDLLGGFLRGKQGNTTEEDYKPFVEIYLDRGNEYRKKPYANIAEYSILLYKLFRCGLAHNLAIKKVGFGYGEIYFREEDGYYYISVDKLLEDLKQAFANYMHDAKENNKGLQKEFGLRFEQVFIKRE